jgi:hypothetical protein
MSPAIRFSDGLRTKAVATPSISVDPQRLEKKLQWKVRKGSPAVVACAMGWWDGEVKHSRPCETFPLVLEAYRRGRPRVHLDERR